MADLTHQEHPVATPAEIWAILRETAEMQKKAEKDLKKWKKENKKRQEESAKELEKWQEERAKELEKRQEESAKELEKWQEERAKELEKRQEESAKELEKWQEERAKDFEEWKEENKKSKKELDRKMGALPTASAMSLNTLWPPAFSKSLTPWGLGLTKSRKTERSPRHPTAG